MAKRRYSEDLFKDTTMTFGEHLEELRGCLFRSIVGLMLGFVVGLYYGSDFVQYVEGPLKDALDVYHQDVSAKKVLEQREELREAGYAVPKDDDAVEEAVAKPLPGKSPQDGGCVFEEVYVNPREVLLRLKEAYPQQFRGIEVPPDPPEGEPFTSVLKPLRIWRPAGDKTELTSLSAHEAFIVYIKGSLLLGALLASPWIFYQIWSFVAAGLYPHERRYVHVFLPISLGLFLTGAATAFYLVFGPVLKFLFHFNMVMGIVPDMRLNEWWSFVLLLPLGFGISFQLPLVMLFLERIGIFDVAAYLSKWRIAILVIFVASMLLTPADPTSMMLMAAPLTILYFGGIALCKWMPKGQSLFDELDE
jgi:sec-independent protein translocase protein TatC